MKLDKIIAANLIGSILSGFGWAFLYVKMPILSCFFFFGATVCFGTSLIIQFTE